MSTPAETFALEAEDLLQTLERALLELEAAPQDGALIDTAFRALHTLKGSGDMFGFSELARFAHHFETAFDRVRGGQAPVTPALIEVALDSRDHLAALLEAGDDERGRAGRAATGEALLARLAALDEGAAPAPAELATEAAAEPADARPRRWRIRFRPDPAAMRHGFRSDLLLAELARLGSLEAACLDADVPPIETLDAADIHLAWEMTLETAAGREAVEDAFLFLQEGDLAVEPLGEAAAAPPDAAPSPAPAAPAVAAASGAPAGRAPDAAGGSEPRDNRAPGARSDMVRVQAGRLDALMDQLGELVIAQARLKRIADELGDGGLDATAEEIERLVTGLRDATLSIRMLPISLVFGKFRRVVRDLSVELGKPAVFETEGGETEVDKNVIDSLTEPLVHMIRNALDHGVETPEARRAAGKPEAATIRLRARQAGGEVLISVSDDGRGLDADAIRRRAVERGLLAPEAEPTEEALYQLIFEPGFSTAAAVSSVSGRGVGMDAVRRAVDALRGVVEVRSRPGLGTEVTLRLPLTLAIIDGLLVRVGGGGFVLPLSSVEECVELPAAEAARGGGGRAILRLRDRLVPFVALDALFGFEPSNKPGRRVVIVNVDGRRTGLVVDDVVGQHQTVVKPLSAYHRGIEGLAGGTILGDGSVALILDAAALVRRAETAPRAAA